MSHHPVALRSQDGALHIQWSDGVEHSIPWPVIRDACPCATCREERRQPKPLLPILATASPTQPTKMEPLGNYAYSVHFDDGHTSGIYEFALLRAMGEQERERGS